MVGVMKSVETFQNGDRAPIESHEHLRCDGTVLIHHDLSMTCTTEACPVQRGSYEWMLAHRSFHGCDYVLRRCEGCAVEPMAPPWGDAVQKPAA